jgi:signal peptidase I
MKKPKKSVAREYYEAILVAFILALFVRTYIFENFKIPSGSMMDNLLIGDHLVVNKFVFSRNLDTVLHKVLPYRGPQRGDVVVFKYPEDCRRDFIKRCVAVAGDTVEIRSKQLYINHQAQDEPYVVFKDPRIYPNSHNINERERRRDHFGPYLVPEDRIFCLGDNRDNSLDSRFWGPVPLDHVKGRAVLIYWSWEAEPNDWQWRGARHRMKQLGEVFLHFFTKTRWERQFRLIR